MCKRWSTFPFAPTLFICYRTENIPQPVSPNIHSPVFAECFVTSPPAHPSPEPHTKRTQLRRKQSQLPTLIELKPSTALSSTSAASQVAVQHYVANAPFQGFPSGSVVKNPPAMQETWVPPLGWEDPLKQSMAAHSSILAWRIPWMEAIIHRVTKNWMRQK